MKTPSAIRPATLECPKCTQPMHLLPDLPADAWRCEGCQGVWLAMGAADILQERAGEVDTAKAMPVPAGFRNTDVLCPVCGSYELLPMVDVAQPHIHYESCKFCHGRFYDAGEFTDASEETFAESLRALIETVRHNLR